MGVWNMGSMQAWGQVAAVRVSVRGRGRVRGSISV